MKPKSFLVTGASRGLGAAIVTCLSVAGHKVLATARGESALNELWSQDPNVVIHCCDLRDPRQAEILLERAVKEFGALDGLVNNAGVISPIAPLADCDPEDWAQAIAINLTAPAILMRAAIPYLTVSSGRVVNISSGAATKVVQAWGAYCASKAGLLHLTSICAAEYPEVAFFSLRPGTIDTEMQGEIRDSKGMTEADLTKYRELKESGKLVPAQVPARAAAWLVLHGPLSRSGEFIDYTDPLITKGCEELFAHK